MVFPEFSQSVSVDGPALVIGERDPGSVQVAPYVPRFKLLERNRMGEICMATPAISEGNLFFRTQNQVIAVGPK
jgi:hypothetical protein